MEILDYTEKSFVVFGEKTKENIKELKELGGRYNPNLTHPETKEKLVAWIFSKKQKEKVQELLSGQYTVSKLDPIERLGLKDNGPDPPKKSRVKKNELSSTDTQTLSFTTIVPKVGKQIKLMNEQKETLILDIVETKKDEYGYVVEFKAKKDDMEVDFVMVGRKWRRLITDIPEWMNFIE